MSEPVVLVGRRPDGGRRDLVWEHCKRQWHECLGWPIAEGLHEGPEPFSLAAASNDAAAIARRNYDWNVALYAGADFLPSTTAQCHAGVELALRRRQLVFCHDVQWRLSERGTEEALAGVPLAQTQKESGPHGNTFSGVLALPRSLFDAVGGFDERFSSWGWEDLALWSACWTFGQGFQRVPGAIYHLWHPPAEQDSSAHEELGRRYLDARGNRRTMGAILREPGGPLDRREAA